jgi:transcriptional regulator with XRE-family HTH domain
MPAVPKASPFGIRLKAARNLRQLSQLELSERSKVPVAMISHFETGVRANASADNLKKLANALNVSLDYLLNRSDDPTPRDGPVQAALLRTLHDAPQDVMDSVVRIAETLMKQERDRAKGRE